MPNIQINRTLIVLDLETTGTWINKDKIIEIAMVKCHPDGVREVYEKRINPQMKIPAQVSELLGITDDDVKNAPVFKDVAQEILNFLDQHDLAGFNIERFDIPLLTREFEEAGHNWIRKDVTVYDVQKIYHLNEKRDLSAAYEFYCHKTLDNAHNALADTNATLEILFSQAQKYSPDHPALEPLLQYDYKRMADYYDDERKFRWWNGKLYMMFGKYAKRYSLQELVKKDPKYLEWILSANFSNEVKLLIQDALKGKFPVCDTEDKP